MTPSVTNPLYSAYERRLVAQLPADRLPCHVGVMLDGNRRWARSKGAGTAEGHQAGADRIEHLLAWCDELGIEYVTLWLLSTDNLRRDPAELEPLLAIIETTVEDLATQQRWRINPVGALDLLPPRTAETLRRCAALTRDIEGLVCNVAVGYGGRREIADAVKDLLRAQAAKGLTLDEIIESVDVDQIADHLYTKGQPDPDLVIRTSGEQRIGGFLLWQSIHSEFYFCEAFWPDFRRVDFLRAIRSYAERERRLGR